MSLKRIKQSVKLRRGNWKR